MKNVEGFRCYNNWLLACCHLINTLRSTLITLKLTATLFFVFNFITYKVID